MKCALPLFTALLLIGCKALPPESRFADADLASRASWAALPKARGGVDTDWVRRFGDRRLDGLVAEALARNPDLQAAAARVEQAKADARAARGLRGPQLDTRLRGLTQKQNFVGFPFGGPTAPSVLTSESEAWQLSADVAWELDLWGRIRAGESAALAAYQSAQAAEDAARASLAAEVCRGWFALAEAEEQVRLAGDAVETTSETVRVIQERFLTGQAGDGGTGAQLRLAMSDVATAQADLETAKRLRDLARRQLEALLGRYPVGQLANGGQLPDPGKPPPSGLPSELLARRPDVVAAERRFAAQGARKKEARLALFPTLSLTGSYGTSTESLKDVLNSDFGVWSLAGGIVQPIFYSGRILAEVDKRGGEERESLAELQSTVLTAFTEVEQALAAEQMLRARTAYLKEAVDLAREADEEARADYFNGRGDALTVLSTQVRFVQRQRELAAAKRDRLENRVNLHLALGGDFR